MWWAWMLGGFAAGAVIVALILVAYVRLVTVPTVRSQTLDDLAALARDPAYAEWSAIQVIERAKAAQRLLDDARRGKLL